jgi:transposase
VRAAGRRRVVARRSLRCDQPKQILAFFPRLKPFQLTLEATSSYEWFVELVEPLAHRIVLAHPKKLRVIADSTKKDKLDALVRAEFLAFDMIPPALQPSPRSREHRALVWRRRSIANE